MSVAVARIRCSQSRIHPAKKVAVATISKEQPQADGRFRQGALSGRDNSNGASDLMMRGAAHARRTTEAAFGEVPVAAQARASRVLGHESGNLRERWAAMPREENLGGVIADSLPREQTHDPVEDDRGVASPDGTVDTFNSKPISNICNVAVRREQERGSQHANAMVPGFLRRINERHIAA